MRKLSKYADAYAKRYDPSAQGVLIHSYARGTPGYELEVIRANGSTLGVYTVGHAQLMNHYANTKKPEQK
jgi:hypothetical protein